MSILAGYLQLLLVTTPTWDESQGFLRLYERERDNLPWKLIEEPIRVVVGKKGLAWGNGLHPKMSQHSYKVEGDSKSPAGIFSLGKVFGFKPPSLMTHVKMEYLEIDEHIEAVDDPLSSFYNCVVNRKEMICDWQSSEKMAEEPLYRIGVIINHNYPHIEKGAGSAIFFHIWRDDDGGTAGCTAMDEKDLDQLIAWLEPQKQPALVQLSIESYHELKDSWNLPLIR